MHSGILPLCIHAAHFHARLNKAAKAPCRRVISVKLLPDKRKVFQRLRIFFIISTGAEQVHQHFSHFKIQTCSYSLVIRPYATPLNNQFFQTLPQPICSINHVPSPLTAKGSY